MTIIVRTLLRNIQATKNIKICLYDFFGSDYKIEKKQEKTVPKKRRCEERQKCCQSIRDRKETVNTYDDSV